MLTRYVGIQTVQFIHSKEPIYENLFHFIRASQRRLIISTTLHLTIVQSVQNFKKRENETKRKILTMKF